MATDTLNPPITVKTPLSMAELLELTQGARVATYKPTIIKFVKSGETYVDVMEMLDFQNKKIDSVYNSFNNNLKVLKADNPDWPDIRLVKKDESVFLINHTVLSGAVEA